MSKQCSWIVAVALGIGGGAAVAAEGDLARARKLFGQNRWAEAREELRSGLSSLAPKDREQARFLLGLSHVREAELYHGLRELATGVGLDYLAELAASPENEGVPWIPLFTGLYQLEAGQAQEAERALALASSSESLPPEWKERARLRLAVARHRRGGPPSPILAENDTTEGRYWRALLGETSRPPAAVVESLLESVDPDSPDVEDRSDPEKVLRFFDPLRLAARERLAWERAVSELTPLAERGGGMAAKLARFHAGSSLFFLGEVEAAASFLRPLDASDLGPVFYSRVRLVLAAAPWEHELPEAAELASVWESTGHYPDAVLLWKELERAELSQLEPFHTQLRARLEALSGSFGDRADEILVGRWGLTALASGVESADVLRTLSRFRNHANKNKIEWNDPLLLVALSAANYRNNDYPQALETLFELSKSFPGLRALQWNLQGVYVARQRAAGDARITN